MHAGNANEEQRLSVPGALSEAKHFVRLDYRFLRPPPLSGGIGPTNKHQGFRARSVERGEAGGKPAE